MAFRNGRLYFEYRIKKLPLQLNVKLWEAQSGTELHTFDGYSVVFSPDGRCIITGNKDKTAKLWDVESGLLLANLISFERGRWALTEMWPFECLALQYGRALERKIIEHHEKKS